MFGKHKDKSKEVTNEKVTSIKNDKSKAQKKTKKEKPKENKPKVREKKPKEEKLTIFSSIKRLYQAYKARVAEEGGEVRKQHQHRRNAIMRETQIETTLKYQFSEEVAKINNGEIQSFKFKISREAFPFFSSILSADEFRHLEFEQVGDLTYEVTAKDQVLD